MVMVEDFEERMGLEATYFRIKARDVVHVLNLYRMMHQWLVEERYALENKNFPEVYYRERRKDTGIYSFVFWRAAYIPQGNKFYRRVFDVNIKILGNKEVEVVQEGKKFKSNIADVEIKVWAWLEVDYEKKWREGVILKHLLDLYWKRLFFRDFEMHKQEVIRDAQAFHNAMSQFLNLKHFGESHDGHEEHEPNFHAMSEH